MTLLVAIRFTLHVVVEEGCTFLQVREKAIRTMGVDKIRITIFILVLILNIVEFLAPTLLAVSCGPKFLLFGRSGQVTERGLSFSSIMHMRNNFLFTQQQQ